MDDELFKEVLIEQLRKINENLGDIRNSIVNLDSAIVLHRPSRIGIDLDYNVEEAIKNIAEYLKPTVEVRKVEAKDFPLPKKRKILEK